MESERQSELLKSLPLQTRDLLTAIADLDLRSEYFQVIWLIQAYAAGRLKDLGDEQVTPRIREDDLPEKPPEAVRVRAFRSPGPKPFVRADEH